MINHVYVKIKSFSFVKIIYMNQIVVMPQEQLAALIREIMKDLLSPAFPPYHSSTGDAKKVLYTRNEVAKLLKCTPNTVTKYIRQGKLHATLLNGVYRINETELVRFINQKAK